MTGQSMYVACPSCRALYRLRPEHLNAAGGRVRCGACRTTFIAAGAAFEDPQAALAAVQKPREFVRDIDALISRALEQVPRSVKPPAPAEARAEAQAPQPEKVGGGSDFDDAEAPLQPNGAASRAEAREEKAAEGATHAPSHAVAFQSDGAPDTRQPPGERHNEASDLRLQPAGSARDGAPRSPPAEDDRPRAALPPGAAQPIGVASRAPMLRADVDLHAQPAAGEFVPGPRSTEYARAALPTLLLEDEYRDGISPRAWGAVAASLLLAALLAAQYLYAERHRLASVAELRPVLELGCGVLGCDLPLRRDLSKIEILEREVRDHPHADDALLINVTFVNRADFAQAFPYVEVAFSDVSGTRVAARRFSAEEYLPNRRQAHASMQPGERARLMLEVVDPGDRAVSFQFEFL